MLTIQRNLQVIPKCFTQETVVQRCSVKKVFLNISENVLKKTCTRASFFNFIKKRLWHRCFLVNFVKFLGTTIFIEHLWLLLLLCFYFMTPKMLHILMSHFAHLDIEMLLKSLISHLSYLNVSQQNGPRNFKSTFLDLMIL